MVLHNQTLLIVCLISGLAALVGCSTTTRSVLPEKGATMTQIYQQKMHESDEQTEGLEAARDKANAGWLGDANTSQYGYTRTSSNELKNLFPKLPNPTVVMYVYPHLAGSDEAPVPGYSTAFTLYKQDHYALPGELAKQGRY